MILFSRGIKGAIPGETGGYKEILFSRGIKGAIPGKTGGYKDDFIFQRY